MQQTLIHHNPSHRRLILLFAGWAMDPHPFERLKRPGYDLMIVWDYRDRSFDYNRLTAYDEIAVVAWSYGVYHANETLAKASCLPVTVTIAVNGTLYPVDDTRGIPHRVFTMTLRGMSVAALDSFNRRMCGTEEAYEHFCGTAPRRHIDDVTDELRSFDREYGEPEAMLAWTHVIVSRLDKIIDRRNQLNAWGSDRCIILDGAHHYVDLQQILDRYVVAKEMVAKSFRRHAPTYDANAGVQARVASRLWQLFRQHAHAAKHSYDTVLEIGSGTGLLTRLYINDISYNRLKLWDISGHTPDMAGVRPECVEACDAEIAIRQIPDGSVDLIVSSATLQWFNDLPTFIAHTRRVLKPGGYAAYSYFTPGTCSELTSLTGNSLAFPELPDKSDDIIHAESEMVGELFDTPSDVLRHLRMTGVNSLGNNHMTNGRIKRLIDMYPRTADGKAPLTYHAAYVIIHKPE